MTTVEEIQRALERLNSDGHWEILSWLEQLPLRRTYGAVRARYLARASIFKSARILMTFNTSRI